MRGLVERVDVSPAGADTLSWAEKVRRLIGQFKTQGPEYVMRRAVDDLGMTRERARSCVKAHWDRIA